MADLIIAPAGCTPASSWEPGPAYVPAPAPPIIFAPLLDPISGELLDLFTGRDPIPCAILEQFRIRRASGAAVMNDGRDYMPGAKNDNTMEARIRTEVARIFKPFVQAGQATLDRIDVTAGPKAGTIASVTVYFTDRTTGRPDNIPLRTQ